MKLDPRFPDRPTHRDFDLLSKLAIEQDNFAGSFQEITQGVVDPSSLLYLASTRADLAVDTIDEAGIHPDDRIKAGILAGIFDGFMLGYKFARQSLIQAEDDWIAPDGSRRTKD